MRAAQPSGALVTGAFGTGKTSVVEEIAEILERAGIPYGAIDLDWLCWFDAPGVDDITTEQILMSNLGVVVDNYLAVGAHRFMLAGAYGDPDEVERLRGALPFPLTVVRLTLEIEEIEARLGSAVTVGRADDLAQARRWIATGKDSAIGDLVLANDRPIREIASEILEFLHWT